METPDNKIELDIDIQPTPNPNALKFILNIPVKNIGIVINEKTKRYERNQR